MQAVGTSRKSEDFAKYMMRIRSRFQCNQREFAVLCGISAAYICRIEGHGWIPRFETCQEIADNLKVDRWELLRAAGYAPAEARTI